mgnify:CR=1 FL=1
MQRSRVLLTGGMGFIGSHTLISLYNNGYDPVIVDNLANSKSDVLNKIKKICKYEPIFYEGDIGNQDFITNIFKENKFIAVMHFAGLKSVADSILKPKKYYQNNVIGTKTLLRVMLRFNCNILIFSSSATVYGYPKELPIKESHELRPLNPYGENKRDIEDICKKISEENEDFSCIALRYFNPIGAHPSGLIGEDPNGIPNNIIPIICNVALGIQSRLQVFGNDYKTHDGTCIRDYIHVEDLAKGHVAALSFAKKNKGFLPINLGTGNGYSVLEILNNFELINEISIPYKISNRREGDAAAAIACPELARKILGWEVNYKLEDMLKSAWQWKNK